VTLLEPGSDVILQLLGDLDHQLQFLAGNISCRIVAGRISLVRKRPHLADQLRIGANGELQALNGFQVVASLSFRPVAAGAKRDGRCRKRGTESGDKPEIR
jgi:hypothetical protein